MEGCKLTPGHMFSETSTAEPPTQSNGALEGGATGPSAPKPSQLDAQLRRLGDNSVRFARLPAADKAQLLREVARRFYAQSAAMVEVANRAKAVEPESMLAGEEWFSGPVISLRGMRLFAQSLDDVARYGAPRIPDSHLTTLASGQRAVRLTPGDAYDSALFRGWRADAWLEPGVELQRIAESQASFYRERDPDGRVVLVLGAGNVASISVLDVLYHSFVEGSVCLLKMSPVNAYLLPFYERAFEPLIAQGFLAITHGAGEVGAYLTAHAGVEAIHVTGSADTHDLIVWGPPGPEREARRRSNSPLTHKRVTSELGNISPVLVVPARYTDAELSAAARSIAGMVVHNASFNCNAAKMLVTARGWPQREDLLRRVGEVLTKSPTRRAYYPGARGRFSSLLAAAADAKVERFGEPGEGALPWTLITGLDPSSESPLFRVEPFCAILSEVSLEATDAAEFLALAADFANERLWGTLNVMLIAPPSVEKDPALAGSLAAAVAALRYGTVSVNLWPAAGYGLGSPPWGGYPGATLADVQSGIGWGHNALLLDHVQKVVLHGPLLGFPQPFWFPGHAHLSELGAALAGVEASPGLGGVLRAAWAAVRP